MQKALAKAPVETASAMRSLSKEEKDAFMESHRDQSISMLRVAMGNFVQKKSSVSCSDRMDVHHDYVDLPTLEKRYEGREDQLQNILRRAPTIEHPTRGVTLYDDSTITAVHSKAKVDEEVETVTLDSQGVGQRRKRAKAKAGPAALEDRQPSATDVKKAK